jgi:hypothetical protein
MTRPIDESWANLPPEGEKEKVDWDAIIDADDDRVDVDDDHVDVDDDGVDADEDGSDIDTPPPERGDRPT